jgi:hypothetical protein
MGCVASKQVTPNLSNRSASSSASAEDHVEWKILPSSTEARQKFEADGTLNKDSELEHLEMRGMLEDAFSQNAIGKYAKTVGFLAPFMCWIDIQEFKSIPVESYRRSKALHIYHKYIKLNAVLIVDQLEEEQRDKYKQLLDESKDDPELLGKTFYDQLQTSCFMAIYQNIYIPYKKTSEFTDLMKAIKKRYNRVGINDFEYFNKLGEGGFGFVVHCRKKSTKIHYAMKLQTKKGLLECFQDDPWRADFEKQAFASCQHPFIVNLDYAFQTDSLAIMVLGLATGGDLQKALNKSPEERLSEERVQFYVAEIVCALAYLHQMGLMYRDLKPNNVLLNDDGHIQLVDLGGVADESGGTLGRRQDAQGLGPLFVQTFAKKVAAAKHGTEDALLSTVKETTEEGNTGGGDADSAKYSEIPTLTAADGGAGAGAAKPPLKRKLSIMGTFG